MQPSPPRAINPRHLGLTRRQSFDPLSSKLSLSQSLSLGNLPSPTFGHIPAGQRSVPAVDLNRRLGGAGAFRSVSGPLGDGQRTPGGSLVVGAEIFGFGGPKGKDRWGNGSVAGDDTTADDDPSQLENEQGGWPSEFEAAVNANKDGSARKGLHGLETSSAVSCSSSVPPSGSAPRVPLSAFELLSLHGDRLLVTEANAFPSTPFSFLSSLPTSGLHPEWPAAPHVEAVRLVHRPPLLGVRLEHRRAHPRTFAPRPRTRKVRTPTRFNYTPFCGCCSLALRIRRRPLRIPVSCDAPFCQRGTGDGRTPLLKLFAVRVPSGGRVLLARLCDGWTSSQWWRSPASAILQRRIRRFRHRSASIVAGRPRLRTPERQPQRRGPRTCRWLSQPSAAAGPTPRLRNGRILWSRRASGSSGHEWLRALLRVALHGPAEPLLGCVQRSHRLLPASKR